jgi:diguanylate cyclase (GGDEF)-like protein
MTGQRPSSLGLAHHDALTGLPNRVLFNERLEQTLAALGKRSTSIAVLYLDLDDFKAINDTLGHPVGDELRPPQGCVKPRRMAS